MSFRFPRLQTLRLVLREPVREDATAILEEYAGDPDVTRYLTWRPHRTLATVHEFLDEMIERNRLGEDIVWAITEAGSQRVIGMIGAQLRDHKAEVGYVLGRGYWNRGYMTEALETVAAWALARPAISRVGAVCDVENGASARTLEKAGFTREGTLLNWLVHPNRADDARDCHIYSRIS